MPSAAAVVAVAAVVVVVLLLQPKCTPVLLAFTCSAAGLGSRSTYATRSASGAVGPTQKVQLYRRLRICTRGTRHTVQDSAGKEGRTHTNVPFFASRSRPGVKWHPNVALQDRLGRCRGRSDAPVRRPAHGEGPTAVPQFKPQTK